MKPTYHCELLEIVQWFNGKWVAKIKCQEHPNWRGVEGFTSNIRSIDFENKTMETRNSIYHWGK